VAEEFAARDIASAHPCEHERHHQAGQACANHGAGDRRRSDRDVVDQRVGTLTGESPLCDAVEIQRVELIAVGEIEGYLKSFGEAVDGVASEAECDR
jgi:hypothetical protein